MNFIAAKDTPSHIETLMQSHQLQGLVLVLIVLALAFFASRAKWTLPERRRRQSYRPTGTKQKPHAVPPAQANMADPTDQMRAIAKVQFERTSLLNKEEAKVLPLLESVTQQIDRGHRVMAQTSMGEVLKPRKGSGSSLELKNAFSSINSKRLDFAIFDRFGMMVCAIEYQGSGHYQGNAFMRDTVKREVLRRTNVPLIEVPKQFNPTDIKNSVSRILCPDTAASKHGHAPVHV